MIKLNVVSKKGTVISGHGGALGLGVCYTYGNTYKNLPMPKTFNIIRRPINCTLFHYYTNVKVGGWGV